MIKLIFYFLLAYLIYQVIRFFQSLSRRSPRPQNPRPRLSGMMVKDQICNTYLPKEEAIREVFDGKEYFFCSKECRQKFLETREN
ncbi:MAG: YHS domain-containing protein [Candidatus Aminicenantales bacterium]